MLQIYHIVILMISINLFLVYVTGSTASVDQITTNNIPSCNEEDHNINECLVNVFNQMIPRSKNGIPELNIPPMDPFLINQTSYIFSHPIFEGKLSVRNVKIYGLSKVKTKNIKYKREGKRATLTIESYIPKMFMEGMYKAKIRFNTANISSRGPFNMTFTNINVTTEGSADLYEKDDHLYMRLKSWNFDPTVGNVLFRAEGLMPDPLLNDAILEFLNQNWRSIYKTLIPETRAAWEPEFIKLGNEYFSHLPIDSVLKPRGQI